MKKKKTGYIIPQGTKQETGVDLYIKKTGKKIVKDAKINNKAELKKKEEDAQSKEE